MCPSDLECGMLLGIGKKGTSLPDGYRHALGEGEDEELVGRESDPISGDLSQSCWWLS